MLDFRTGIEVDLEAKMKNASLADVRTAIRRKRYHAAKALIDGRLEEKPDDVEALCLGALVYWQGAFDLEQSASMLRRARDLAPESAPVMTLSAEFELHFGGIEKCLGYANKALSINERNVTAYVVLARASPAGVNQKTLDDMIKLADGTDIARRPRGASSWVTMFAPVCCNASPSAASGVSVSSKSRR